MQGFFCDKYRIVGKIDEGGMAEVYAAVDRLGRQVAIKLLHPDRAEVEDIVERFRKEARAAAKIKHPGVVEIYDLDKTPDGRVYIVMEMLHGESLKKRLQRLGRLPVPAAVSLIRQLAQVMNAVHADGIVHRDLKPDNVFVVPDKLSGERIKVLDFGFAKILHDMGPALTNDGVTFGTPAYMSPEQCQNPAGIDHRADLYSMGCILYRCLCGVPVFRRNSPTEVVFAQIEHTPVHPHRHRPDIPPHIAELIAGLLKKNPQQRVQSCDELIAALDGPGASPTDSTLVEMPEPTTQSAWTTSGDDLDDDVTFLHADEITEESEEQTTNVVPDRRGDVRDAVPLPGILGDTEPLDRPNAAAIISPPPRQHQRPSTAQSSPSVNAEMIARPPDSGRWALWQPMRIRHLLWFCGGLTAIGIAIGAALASAGSSPVEPRARGPEASESAEKIDERDREGTPEAPVGLLGQITSQANKLQAWLIALAERPGKTREHVQALLDRCARPADAAPAEAPSSAAEDVPAASTPAEDEDSKAANPAKPAKPNPGCYLPGRSKRSSRP